MPQNTSYSTSHWTVLARLLRPQGRKGELLAELYTDFPESLAGRTGLLLAPQGFRGTAEEARPTQVLSSWLPVGRNKGRIVFQLAGVDSISAAEALAGLELITADDQRLPLDAESVYISDLTGCAVYDRDTLIGEITNVNFPASSEGQRLDDAPPLLEVHAPDGGEVLIPFVKAYLKSINLPAKRIVLDLPKGLVEVNR